MTETDDAALCARFAHALAGAEAVTGPLEEFRVLADARAIGLWRRVGEDLQQLGFCACAEMPQVVADEFLAATRTVPLERRGLGIVEAVMTNATAEARIEGTELHRSASWLARFESPQSLSVPVRKAGLPVAVLAIANRTLLPPGHATWLRIERLAERMGEVF